MSFLLCIVLLLLMTIKKQKTNTRQCKYAVIGKLNVNPFRNKFILVINTFKLLDVSLFLSLIEL